MTTFSFRRSLGMILVFVIVAASFIFVDRRTYLDPFRDGLNEVLSPVSAALYNVVDRPGNPSDLEADLAQASEERDALAAENSRLKAEIADLEQQLLVEDVESRYPGLDLTVANVIRRDPTGSQLFVIIDVGSRDGVQPGMAIVSPHFYVGQVVEVTERTAKVMLIIDASQSVGAMLEDSRAGGILYGQWQHGGYLTLSHVRADIVPIDGEMVVTSELAETQTRQVPPHIPIGRVLGEPVRDPQTDTLEIQIRPGISDFNSLTVVYVAVMADD